MKAQNTNMNDIEKHITEWYDAIESHTQDVELIKRLLGEKKSLRILEPFCGNGRILVPLALEGHEATGMDMAEIMLANAREKINKLDSNIYCRTNLILADVVASPWPDGYDLVILGGNCLYELATPAEQEICIEKAARSLKPGGYIYVDNNHMEGDLDPSWYQGGVHKAEPSGMCSDGTRLESTMETIWYDIPQRLARFKRSTKITLPDGSVIEKAYIQQKHPVSKYEVQGWLETHDFTIEHTFGDRSGTPYKDSSSRAIFWARKLENE